MKVLINDYSGHPFPFELSQHLSKKYKTIHSYAQYFETPKANFKNNSQNRNLKIFPIKINKKFKKDNFFSRRSNDILYGKKVIKLIEDQNPTIVVCSQVPLDPLINIIILCKQKNIKTIFWIQDIYSLAIGKILNKKIPIIGKLIGKYYYYKEKKCEHLSDKIVVISSDFKKFLDKKSLKKTSIVENWSPIIKPKISKIKFYKKKFNPLKKFCFIYSGTLGYKHNSELFLKIAKRFPETIIIISSAGKFALELKKISQNECPNIKVVNWINYKDLSSFLSIADAFIVTMNKNASTFSVPSKIYAYFVIGKPILGSMPFENLGSKKIKQFKAGYISKPQNVQHFMDNCKKIINNKKLRDSFSHNCKNYLNYRKIPINKMLSIIEGE